MLTHQSNATAVIFPHPSSCVFVHKWVAWLCFHVEEMAFQLLVFHKDHLWSDFSGCRWGPTGFWQLWVDGADGHLLIVKGTTTLFLWPTAAIWLSNLSVSLCFCRRAWTAHHLISACERTCCYAHSCHSINIFRFNCHYQPHSFSMAVSTQLFLFKQLYAHRNAYILYILTYSLSLTLLLCYYTNLMNADTWDE